MKKIVRAFKGVKQLPLLDRCIIKPYDGNCFIIIPRCDADEETGYIVSSARIIDFGINHDIQMIGYIPPHQHLWEVERYGTLIIESSMNNEGEILPEGKKPAQFIKDSLKLIDEHERNCSDGTYPDCQVYYHCNCVGCPMRVIHEDPDADEMQNY